MSRAEERRLIAAARSGDARALRRVLETVSGPAYRFGRGFCRDEHAAQEIAQEVLTSLVRSLRGFRADSSLSTWAYVVARNACGRRRRREATRSRNVQSLDERTETGRPGVEVPDPAGDPEHQLERRQTRELLARALATLPAAQREVVILRDVEGLPAAEVAAVIGIGERAVKSRLHRGRTALRDLLAPLAARFGRSGARCPDVTRLVSRHREGDLDERTCARLEAHVAGCPGCSSACDSLLAALKTCRSCREKALPSALREAVRDAARKHIAAAAPRD